MKRWPLIRHIRYFWSRMKVYEWASQWGELGIGTGHPNQSDLDYLEAIWKGKA